jgi:hypothetical protein
LATTRQFIFFLCNGYKQMDGFVGDMISRVIKYLIEGLAVAFAALLIPRSSLRGGEVVALAVTAAAVFILLDFVSPGIGVTARQGAGFGLGANLVGFPMRR